MPLSLKELPETDEKFSRCMTIEDTGILCLSNQHQGQKFPIKHPRPNEVLSWLNSYADEYWKLKNPGEELCTENEESKDDTTEESTPNGKTSEEESKTEEKEEEKSDEKVSDEKEKSKPSTPKSKQPQKKINNTPIQFLLRDMRPENPGVIFCASNLEDPGDYLHYIFEQMMANPKDKNNIKGKSFGRIMPVHGLCMVNQPGAMENLTNSIVEKTINKDDQSQRFSIMYYDSETFETEDNQYRVNQLRNYQHNDQRNHQSLVIQKDAIACVRNCIWALNPNCVQCLKYQDINFCIDVIKPFFAIGYLYDFSRLRRYFTFMMTRGIDTTEEGDDSEDDISDDPTLNEEEDIKRKMRIKSRKRRAAKEAAEEVDEKVSKMEDVEGEENKESEQEAASAETNGVNGHDDSKE